jgi:N-methylhydantoinase A
MALATEKMVGAIEEITINQGIDPQSAVLIGGGGAAGLNAVAVARRLGCAEVVIPEVGAALSAAGALMSDLSAEFATMSFTTSERFASATSNQILAALARQCQAFIDGPCAGSLEQTIEYAVEARYPHQIWEIEVPLRIAQFGGPDELAGLVADFHAAHHELFEISDADSGIELVTWRARVGCRLRHGATERLVAGAPGVDLEARRKVYFAGHGWVDAAVRRFEAVSETDPLDGPAIVESSFTTVVVDPGARARRTASGSLVIGA